LQGFSETALSFAIHGGLNVTGLSLVDSSNHSNKAFVKAWQGHDTGGKWSGGSGQNRITVSHDLTPSRFHVLSIGCTTVEVLWS